MQLPELTVETLCDVYGIEGTSEDEFIDELSFQNNPIGKVVLGGKTYAVKIGEEAFELHPNSMVQKTDLPYEKSRSSLIQKLREANFPSPLPLMNREGRSTSWFADHKNGFIVEVYLMPWFEGVSGDVWVAQGSENEQRVRTAVLMRQVGSLLGDMHSVPVNAGNKSVEAYLHSYTQDWSRLLNTFEYLGQRERKVAQRVRFLVNRWETSYASAKTELQNYGVQLCIDHANLGFENTMIGEEGDVVLTHFDSLEIAPAAVAVNFYAALMQHDGGGRDTRPFFDAYIKRGKEVGAPVQDAENLYLVAWMDRMYYELQNALVEPPEFWPSVTELPVVPDFDSDMTSLDRINTLLLNPPTMTTGQGIGIDTR